MHFFPLHYLSFKTTLSSLERQKYRDRKNTMIYWVPITWLQTVLNFISAVQVLKTASLLQSVLLFLQKHMLNAALSNLELLSVLQHNSCTFLSTIKVSYKRGLLIFFVFEPVLFSTCRAV